MLWDAAEDYSNRKRTQGKTEQQEKEEEKEIGIEASLTVQLKYYYFPNSIGLNHWSISGIYKRLVMPAGSPRLDRIPDLASFIMVESPAVKV